MGDEPKPSCSFCGKTQDEVCVLIAGPQAYICEECVEASVHILKRQGTWPAAPVYLFRAMRYRLTGR